MSRGRRAAATAEGLVEVRMLVDTEHEGTVLPCNTVQALDPDVAAAMVGANFADASAEGIEYARETPEHQAWLKKQEAKQE